MDLPGNGLVNTISSFRLDDLLPINIVTDVIILVIPMQWDPKQNRRTIDNVRVKASIEGAREIPLLLIEVGQLTSQ